MSRSGTAGSARPGRAPRASGGVPERTRYTTGTPACSPRERGCPTLREKLAAAQAVLPARAGVSRAPCPRPPRPGRAPRASGGVPSPLSEPSPRSSCSPRERGCPGCTAGVSTLADVLPARAGVSRMARIGAARNLRAPRASGGVPPGFDGLMVGLRCSPRERGCPDPRGSGSLSRIVLPARAGVSPSALRSMVCVRCSPRERGCPAHRSPRCLTCTVLPARAGVSRSPPTRSPLPSSAPRASGGVPAVEG